MENSTIKNTSNLSSIINYENDNNTDLNSDNIIKIITFFIVGGFGIIGNIFFIVLAVKFTVKRNLHHLIINMAVSDTLIILIAWNIQFLNWFDGRAWGYLRKYSGDVFCKMPRFILAASMWSVFFTLLAISIERFRATRVATLQRLGLYTLKQRLTVLAFIWISAIALGCNELEISYINKQYNTCAFKPTSTVILIIFSISTFSGLFVFLFLNLYTLKRLSKQEIIQDSIPERQRRDRARRTANAIKMVLCSFLVFCCCYAFVQIGNVMKFFGIGIVKALGVHWYWFQFAISLSPLINSALSPCIYLIFLKDFQLAMKEILLSKISLLNRNRNNTNSRNDASDKTAGIASTSGQNRCMNCTGMTTSKTSNT